MNTDELIPAEVDGDSAFDYIPSEHRAVVALATADITGRMRDIATHIFEIGRQLICVKGVLEPGTFHDWVSYEFGLKERKAEHLMNVHRNLGVEKHIFGRLKPTALYHLSMPSTPLVAIARVRELIQEGHIPNVPEVIAIIDTYKHERSAHDEDAHRETPSQRLAEAFCIVHTAVSDEIIADCEQVLGEKVAHRLDELRTEFDELLEKLEARQSKVVNRRVSQRSARAKTRASGSESRHDNDIEQIVPGCVVTVVDMSTLETACYTIVMYDQDRSVNDGISKASPLAQALLGKKVEEIATVQTTEGIVDYAITGIGFPDGRQVATRKQPYAVIDLDAILPILPESRKVHHSK